jgi:hypothetical protein
VREQILELLELPRRIALSGVAIETCPHGGQFVEGVPECTLCHSRLECEWLYHSDEFSTLKARGAEELLEALRFAVSYVDAHVTLQRHRRGECTCAICTWLGEAGALLDRAEHAP